MKRILSFLTLSFLATTSLEAKFDVEAVLQYDDPVRVKREIYNRINILALKEFESSKRHKLFNGDKEKRTEPFVKERNALVKLLNLKVSKSEPVAEEFARAIAEYEGAHKARKTLIMKFNPETATLQNFEDRLTYLVLKDNFMGTSHNSAFFSKCQTTYSKLMVDPRLEDGAQLTVYTEVKQVYREAEERKKRVKEGHLNPQEARNKMGKVTFRDMLTTEIDWSDSVMMGFASIIREKMFFLSSVSLKQVDLVQNAVNFEREKKAYYKLGELIVSKQLGKEPLESQGELLKEYEDAVKVRKAFIPKFDSSKASLDEIKWQWDYELIKELKKGTFFFHNSIPTPLPDLDKVVLKHSSEEGPMLDLLFGYCIRQLPKATEEWRQAYIQGEKAKKAAKLTAKRSNLKKQMEALRQANKAREKAEAELTAIK